MTSNLRSEEMTIGGQREVTSDGQSLAGVDRGVAPQITPIAASTRALASDMIASGFEQIMRPPVYRRPVYFQSTIDAFEAAGRLDLLAMECRLAGAKSLINTEPTGQSGVLRRRGGRESR